MNVQVVTLAPIALVMVRHQGPYETLSPVFDDLWAWVERHGVPAQRTIGIYWDNPDVVPASRLRSAACVEVPPSYAIMDRGGIRVEPGSLAGGAYATVRFTGPYEELAPVWTALTHYVEHDLRRTISQEPAFEVYVNDASETPPAGLITDLYMPVL